MYKKLDFSAKNVCALYLNLIIYKYIYICTLCFIIFLFYIKSILNIAHVQYSTCAIYRDPTVYEIIKTLSDV